MTRALAERAFRVAYREAVEAVADDTNLSFRLPASNDYLDLRGYLAACEALYVEALELLRAHGDARTLDAGGSFGVLAAALRSLGVVVVDSPAAGEPVDLVVGLALHAQSVLAGTVASYGERLKPGGRLVLVVPSSHYWPRRLADLRGRRPAPPEAGTVELGTPSYSRSQVKALLRRGGLRPELVRARGYSPASIGGPLLQVVSGVLTRTASRHREAWLVLGSRDGDA